MWGFYDYGFTSPLDWYGITMRDAQETSQQFTNIYDKNNEQIYAGDFMMKDGDPRIYEIVIDYDGVRPAHEDQLMSIETIEPRVSLTLLPLAVESKHPLDIISHGKITAEKWSIVGNTVIGIKSIRRT